MALIEKNNAIFLSITDGKISRRVSHPTEKSIQRTTKENKVVNEEFYGAVEGRITNVEFKEHKDYGRFLNVTLTDDGGPMILQMKYPSGYATSFLKALPNADLSEIVKLSPSLKIEGDKKKGTLFINQNGAALKWAYTKDDPNGLPELKQVKVKGKMTWDDSEICEFLENMVKEDILPKLKGVVTPAPVVDDEDQAPF